MLGDDEMHGKTMACSCKSCTINNNLNDNARLNKVIETNPLTAITIKLAPHEFEEFRRQVIP